MSFETEPTGYVKTALSDLQGSWGNLRAVVVENIEHINSNRLLLHIDEGMSWESVRDLKRMESALLLIQNIALQSDSPEEVMEWIAEVKENLNSTLEAIAEGTAR